MFPQKCIVILNVNLNQVTLHMICFQPLNLPFILRQVALQLSSWFPNVPSMHGTICPFCLPNNICPIPFLFFSSLNICSRVLERVACGRTDYDSKERDQCELLLPLLVNGNAFCSCKKYFHSSLLHRELSYSLKLAMSHFSVNFTDIGFLIIS